MGQDFRGTKVEKKRIKYKTFLTGLLGNVKLNYKEKEQATKINSQTVRGNGL